MGDIIVDSLSACLVIKIIGTQLICLGGVMFNVTILTLSRLFPINLKMKTELKWMQNDGDKEGSPRESVVVREEMRDAPLRSQLAWFVNFLWSPEHNVSN